MNQYKNQRAKRFHEVFVESLSKFGKKVILGTPSYKKPKQNGNNPSFVFLYGGGMKKS